MYLQARFEKEIEKDEKPKEHEFKVGDRVQFKSWEEMENKYGLDSRAGQATIKTNPRFLNSMSYLCGTYATIKEIKENGVVELKDFTTGYTNDLFSYSLDMLKPATNEPKFKAGGT